MHEKKGNTDAKVVVVVVVTRSDQPKPPAIAIVRQNSLSSASWDAEQN